MSATIEDLRNAAETVSQSQSLSLTPDECRQIVSQYDSLKTRLEIAERERNALVKWRKEVIAAHESPPTYLIKRTLADAIYKEPTS